MNVQYLMGSAPRRAPFSDWLAQVERRVEHDTGVKLPRFAAPMLPPLRAMYDVGLSPRDVAGDLLSSL